MARTGVLAVILWVVELCAALLLMPLVMIFVVAGLMFNLLRWLAIPLALLAVAVLGTMWMTGVWVPA